MDETVSNALVVAEAANHQPRQVADDPFNWVIRISNRLRTWWMKTNYPFASVGKDFYAHYSLNLRRSISPYVQIGDSVLLDHEVWINIPVAPAHGGAAVIFDDGVKIGRRCMITAANRIHFERDVILGPQVLVMDHNHAFEDINVPIKYQGITSGGTVRIEEGCWIGYGAVILCSKGELVIGRHSVVGANAVVSRSIPPNSVVSGNPARVVKQYDASKGEWVLGSSASSAPSRP